MSEQDAQAEQHKTKIRDFRTELAQIDSKLSEQERLRRSTGKEISFLMTATKKLRAERNAFTANVKEKKEIRHKLNEEIRQKIERIKEFNEKKTDAEHKLGFKENPAAIKRQINILETTIETEAISFEKEKELMRKINDLKKKYVQAEAGSQVWQEAHALSKEIDALKEQADTFHREIQSLAQQSQQKHEIILENSKKIDELKTKEDALKKTITELQTQLNSVSESLQTELKALGDITEQQQEITKKEKQLLKEAEQKKLNEKKKEIEDKLKKGEKLTTQDLLVLQG
ncbi:MAG: hypothetical protein HY363_01980 [Candidatus Aenigmarchaeota archaeon]|nr:hypothetical protein [Candidatus Aenigmarchaeota archaeon]